jgi:hypothetical protein
MPTSEADFAVPSATASPGPNTDPKRKRGVVGKAIDAAKKALSPEKEQGGIFDDEDAPDNQPAPAPSPAQPLPNGLEQIAKEHGLPGDIRKHVLNRCKSEALAVVDAYKRAVEQARPVDEMIDIRFAEARHQRNLDGLPGTIAECLASAAAVALLRDPREPLVGQLLDAAARYRRRCHSEHMDAPLQFFAAKLMQEIEAAEEQARKLDALIGRLVPGESIACRHVTTRLDALRQQFRHADQCRKNPVLAQQDTDHGFIALAQEAAQA